MKKKLAILGASYLQVPLIKKAKDMGLETHVFAWEQGAVGKYLADHFYPVSILEKEKILELCKTIHPDGITSIGSDIAMHAVNFVANEMGLTGNSLHCTKVTTDKYAMRQQLSTARIQCPQFISFNELHPFDLKNTSSLVYPLIVKPVDRSGSRGVTMINDPCRLKDAVDRAMQESFSKSVIVEEFIHGSEYSVEMISWNGEHHFLAITEKVTTGSPYFVEIEQHEPAPVSPEISDRIIQIVLNALSALGVQYGASHSEVMADDHGIPHIIEVGARMGGDNIGAYLVELSTGYDFVKGVIEVALGTEPDIQSKETPRYAGIYYLTPPEGVVKEIVLNPSKHSEIKQYEVFVNTGDTVEYPVKASAQRSGYFIYQSEQPFRIKNPEAIINIITVNEQ